ncbi:MAG: choice-of-anchor J domain-containing protein [Alistipes sp.]|nr:choice-of-anchor J domain-containing protein [Alistipes sp.]
MKKIFTLMWAIVCAALTIVSCTPDNGDDNNGGVVSASKITVTGAPEANLTPAAGELSLGYAIENPTLTDALVVTTEAAWVKVGEIGEATVALTYEANTDAPGSPAREAVIKFAYNGAEDVLVTLKQDSQAPSFEIEWLNVTCGSAQYTCTPADNEMLYLLASTQDLGQIGVQGETPQELMKNYAEMLATYGMLTGEADGWYVFKGATTEMPKDASRFSAEETVSVFALGISATVGEMDPETGMPAITINYLTPVHTWEVPFLPYPTVTVPEAQLTNNVSSAAGELVLDCVLENALNDGSEVTLSTEATWVHPTWADNKLTIAYDANTVAVARRAKIAVQYGWWTNPFEVTLVQEKDATATAITLNLTVKGTQFNGILVDIVPSDENVFYALNYTTPEKDWETGAELPIDWMAKAEELLSYAGNATFHKGALTNYLIKTNVSNYEWYGYDYYVYAIPVALEEIEGAVKVNQILGETTVSDKVTIDVSKMPKLEWDVEKSGLTWNETNGRYDLEVVEGSTVVLHYILTNPVEGALVKLNGTSLYDNYNVVDGEPVIDNAASTITFKIDKFDTAKKYHYVSPGFKYTNEDEDMWGITTPSLRLTQVENKGYALPYEQTFASGQGDWTIDNVDLSTLSYVWKHDSSYKCMKASAYVGSAKATESWLISPKIDLTTATAPVLTFEQAINHAKGTAATTLTLWVKEASATEWTQVTIPSYPASDSWTFYSAGNVDLSAYAGKSIQIAFKYTSTTSIAATWEVKNVVVADAGAAVAPLM